MNQLHAQISHYLNYCQFQKMLNEKTVKAYRIDLSQFKIFFDNEQEPLVKSCIYQYVQALHAKYKPKTVKRKIASIRAFINYLDFDEQIEVNPISKVHLAFREPITLPKSLPLTTIQKLLKATHQSSKQQQSHYQFRVKLRNLAVLELLFATGLRVSELCSITPEEIDLKNGYVKVQGKGARERVIFIGNSDTLEALRAYKKTYGESISEAGWFFVNRSGRRLNEQSVRGIIMTCAKLANISHAMTFICEFQVKPKSV
jgi:integrase/recombinase XerD